MADKVAAGHVGGANGAHPLPAMMNTWAIVSGYVAGDNAVKNASK